MIVELLINLMLTEPVQPLVIMRPWEAEHSNAYWGTGIVCHIFDSYRACESIITF